MADKTTKTNPLPAPGSSPGAWTSPEALKAAGRTASDAGQKTAKAYAEASAEAGAQFDRLVRSQFGHVTSASREALDFVTSSLETTLKANEAARRASLELVEAATSSWSN